MAISRTKSRLTIPAPPPSPIPTGTGSRSAGNETFKKFLETSIQLPQLSLPESRFLSGAIPIPAVIDYRSLTSSRNNGEYVARMLGSVKEFGAFRIVNHGISVEDISSLAMEMEAKCMFEESSKKDKEVYDHNQNREAILQVRYQNSSKKLDNQAFQTELYGNISEKMETISSKLETVAEKLSVFFSEITGDEFAQKLSREETESIFTIYRYNRQTLSEGNPVPIKERNSRGTDNNIMISLHVPGEQCQFYVNPDEGDHISFDAAADTIVATIGKQLQEWRAGKWRSATGEMIFESGGGQASFSIELKFLRPNYSVQTAPSNVISIADQIFAALIVASIYLFYIYISSFFKGI